MGGRGVKLEKRVKWDYGRKSTPEGTPIFTSVRLGCLPHEFLFYALHRRQTDIGLPHRFLLWAWNSFLEDTSIS